MDKITDGSVTGLWFVKDEATRTHSSGESMLLSLDINVVKSCYVMIIGKVQVGKGDPGWANLDCYIKLDDSTYIDRTGISVLDNDPDGNIVFSTILNLYQNHNLKICINPLIVSSGTYFTQYATLTVIALYK